MLMSNFRGNILAAWLSIFIVDLHSPIAMWQHFETPRGLGMSGFPFFAIFVSRLSRILCTRFLHACLSTLAHLMTF